MSGRNHPELRWQVVETPHFRIAYPQHLAGIEYEAAALAETTYAALSRNLGVTFSEKIRIYLSDEDEIVNGFAVPLGTGYTNIWVHPNAVAEGWTGRDKWLRRVLPHELAHIFHYRATRSTLGPLGYLFSDPTPRFWTEGLAQYETERWDAMRGERYLRTAALESRLSYTDGASAWNGRLLYAVGNAQVRFFAQQYGDSSLANLLAHRSPALLGLGRVHDLKKAFPAVTGESYAAFERRWRQHINTQYGARAAALNTPDSLSGRYRAGGQYLYAVQPGPDTSRVAVVRLLSLGRPVRQLVIDGRLPRVIAEGAIQTPVAWNPYGALVAWSQTVRGDNGSLVNDVFLSGTLGEGTRRLTRSRRASAPTFAPDGERLAFVGSDGGTANIFLLTLSTLAETPLTHFTGDVQISSLDWHPAAEQIALALFDGSGNRTVQVLDLATGVLIPVTDGTYDDRHPVWSRDGRFIAYTSLRDGVPNLFRFNPATGAHTRMTAQATGIEGHAWLPPDSTHALGQVVGVSAVSKSYDRAYRVDGARSVGSPADLVPEAFARWETHRPPHEVPLSVPVDSSLIEQRYPYNALANLTHVVSLPFPYAGTEKGYGIGAFTAWTEPLAKHALVLATGIDFAEPAAESFFWMLYRNNTLRPTLDLTVFRFPRTGRLYGSSVLVERLTGASLDAYRPIDRWARPYASLAAGLRLEVTHSTPLNADSLANLPDLPRPAGGTEATVSVRTTYRRQKPYRDAIIHPLDGFAVRAEVRSTLPIPGTPSRFVRGDLRGYTVLPALGLQRLYVYGRAVAQTGTPLPQDYLGLSRYDTWQLSDGSGGALGVRRRERVRGYHESYVIGDQMLYGTLEYRVPLVRDLQTRLFGVVSLGTASLALFADGAVVWNGTDFSNAVQQAGAGAEVKNALRLGSYTLGHALGVAQPVAALFGRDYEVYYRWQLGVPF